MSSSIAITTGEPAGIGPEISVKAVFTGRVKSPVTLIGDKKLLIKTSEKLGFGSIFPDWVKFEHVPLAHPAVPGQLDVANAPYVVETLRRAAQGAQDGTYSAVVTAPVQKSIIIEAGIPFTGHTEFFQQFAGVDRVVMMLTSGTSQQALRVALVTTHLPLQQIPAAITDEALDKTLAICAHALHQDFGIERPRIAVTGLNPHAGESGHMGREEIERIAPAIERYGSFRRIFRSVAGRHDFRAGSLQKFRLHRVHVPSPGTARSQARGLRARHQHHAWAALGTHIGRSRHGTGHCRQRRSSRRKPSCRSFHRTPYGGTPRENPRAAAPARLTYNTTFREHIYGQ